MLSPERDDPIFIGINRLVAKGLENTDSNTSPEYPCHIVNRFECPYKCKNGKPSDTKFDVDDLYDFASIAFAVEIALAVAQKDSSVVQLKNKQDLYQALTNRETFTSILEQGLNYVLSDLETFDDTSRVPEQLQEDNRDRIIDYFMNIKDKIKLEGLRFY